MLESEIKEYIKSKNLVVDTIEQIVSFMFDNDKRYCGSLAWYDKKDVVQFVHGKKFPDIWKLVRIEMQRRQSR